MINVLQYKLQSRKFYVFNTQIIYEPHTPKLFMEDMIFNDMKIWKK